MAKNSSGIRCILLFVALTCSIELHAAISNHITQVYLSQVGVREKTGNNDGSEVEIYLSSVGLKKGNPWCAAFVHWTLQKAGVKGLPKSGYSPSWFPVSNTIYQHKKFEKYTPGPADVFGIYFVEKGRIAHVGFIDEWPAGSYCVTVEGNTNQAGSREGDGVLKKRRLKKQINKVSRWTS